MIIIPISQAKPRLSELVDKSDAEQVVLTRNGSPVAVIMSWERHEAMVDDMDDMGDVIAGYESEGEATVPFGEVEARLDAQDAVAA